MRPIYLFLFIPLLLLVFSGPSTGQSQTATINGHIKNGRGELIPGITLWIEELEKGAATDASGYYKINGLPAGSHSIVVSGIGYLQQEQVITLVAGQNLVLDLNLREATTELEEVTVLGKSSLQETRELAYEVQAIDTRELHNSTLDLGDALDRVSGVRVRESGGVGSRMNFSLNGFTGRQVKFFIDGVPMDNFGSSFQLNNIPVNLAERIEIYKGVVPIWLGSDALGGAVNIVTNQNLRTYLDASYSFGSFNTHRSVLNAGYTSKSGFTVQLNAFQNYSDNNYWVNVDVADINTGKYYRDQKVRRFNDTYHNETIILNVGLVDKKFADKLLFGITLGQNYAEKQHAARLVSVYGDYHRRGNIVMPTLKYQKDNFLIKGLDFSLNANYNFGEEQNIDTVNRRYNWFGDYKQYEGEGGEDSRTLYKYSNNVGIVTANVNYQIDDKQTISFNHVFSTFDRDGSDELEPQNEAYDQPKISKKNVTGLGYKYEFNDRWISTVFVKHYNQSNNYSQLINPSEKPGNGYYLEQVNKFNEVGYGAATTYFLNENLQLKASYEKSLRLPETEELYGDLDALEGNIELDPETSNNYNLGITYNTSFNKAHNFSLSGNLLYRDSKDFIKKQFNTNQVDQIMDNLGKVNNAGVDGEIRYSFRKIFTAGMNMTYQNLRNNTRYEKGETEQSAVFRERIPNIPFLYGNADMSFFLHDLWKVGNLLTVGYNFQYVHAYYLYWANMGSDKFDIGDQLTHDLSVTYSIAEGKYNIALECRNLLDAKLYDNFSLQKPGRSFDIKFRYFINRTNN